MVKGFDPAKSDPANIFLHYIFSAFQTPPSLSPERATQQFKAWLRDPKSETSGLYKAFDRLSIKPKIVMKSECGGFLSPFSWSNADEHFAADQRNDTILVCLDKIKNKIELKQNLDRQLKIMLNIRTITENEGKNDATLMKNLFEGCIQGYQNYGWETKTKERLSKKCAVYLFRRRVQSDLPPDALFRYSSKLADDICQ